MRKATCGRAAVRNVLCALLLAGAQATNYCGGNVNKTDSGGDPCSYYGQHPHLCGCCNTPSFDAYWECCECESMYSLMRGMNATQCASTVFSLWPRKATRLIPECQLPPGMEIPADIAERLPNLVSFALSGQGLVGAIPPQLGSLSLEMLYLDDNHFSGGVPPELGRLTRLKRLHLANNRLSGGLPPELGGLTSLEILEVSGNQLSGGLPSGLRGLTSLERLDLSHNPRLCGDAAVLEELENLTRLDLSGCCFRDEHLPGLPPRLERLVISGNHLSRVPDRWHGQGQSLKELHLENNSISWWDTSSIVPFSHVAIWSCGYRPSKQPLAWHLLEKLDVSLNPLSLAAYDFLESLAHLDQLTDLNASETNLTGSLPGRVGERSFFGIVPGIPHLGDANCSGIPPQPIFRRLFPALERLYLSGNSITSITAILQPRGAMQEVDLRRNALTRLAPEWSRNAIQYYLDVRGNPELHLPVLLDPGGECSISSYELTAHPRQWATTADGRAECTTLCPLPQTQFLVDVTINSSVMCRCLQGQGVGQDCPACPDDMYSGPLSFKNGHYSRQCLECPAGATLPGGQGMCFGDCMCGAGSSMAQIGNGSTLDVGTTPCRRLAAEGRCLSCGLFKTSPKGSRKAADCFCNGNESEGRGWRGLLERQGQCGCPEGTHMNFADRSCEPCQTEEHCEDWTQSLEPPRVKPGFWAAPPPPKGGDGMFGNFARHSIWRCQSTKACPGGPACGQNRTGTACGLCKRGHFSTPTGNCGACLMPYTEARHLLAGLLFASMVFPIAVHFHLKFRASGEPQGLALALQPVLVSIKQMLKFVQVLSLVSLFRVEWPPAADVVFAVSRSFSLDFATWTGVACLDSQQQQTMTFELSFRWVLPLLCVVLTCLAAVLVTLCGLAVAPLWAWWRPQSNARVRQLLSFGLMDVMHVLVFFLSLFFPSLLKNALLPLTCAPSPNGLLTMVAFPATQCWSTGAEDGDGFWPVAVAGLAQTAMLSVGFPLLLFFAWKRIDVGTTVVTRSQSLFEQRKRWWGFLFVDFRGHKMYWALVLVCNDIVLNLIVVLLPSFGTAQLLLTSVVSIAHACQVFCVSPYPNKSNSLLETCTRAGTAAVCIFSAGLGFQAEPDVLDVGAFIAEGRNGSGYLHRTISLVSVQLLTLAGPLAILLYQLLMVFPQCRRCVPSSLRPWTREQREDWSRFFMRVMRISEGPLPSAVAEFDPIDFSAFQQAFTQAPVTREQLSTGSLESGGGEAEKEESLATDTPALQRENAALLEEVIALKVDARQSEEALRKSKQRSEQHEMENQQLKAEIQQLQRQVKPSNKMSL